MRNIILISIDSLRADHCGFMSYGSETTPNIDRLAREGVVFENAIAPGPKTPQSMPAIFTGSHPANHVAGADLATQRHIRAHMDRHRSIPERLGALGYETAGFSPNPFTSPHYGFDAGFDEYHDFLGDDPLASGIRSRVVTNWIKNDTTAGLRFLINMLGLGDISTNWESYYDSALEWTRSAERPYFLWMFLLEPHWPYLPPRRHRNRSLASVYRTNWRRAPVSSGSPSAAETDALLDLYDGAIRHADELLDRIRTDFPGDPVIALHADHGEEFGEHGEFNHSQLYEETIRVPFVIGNVGRSESITAPVSVAALPTILRSVAEGTRDWTDDGGACVTARSGDRVAVRSHRWKYIDGEHPELYDLDADRSESHNAVHAQSDVGEALHGVAARSHEALAERRRIAAGVDDLLGAETESSRV